MLGPTLAPGPYTSECSSTFLSPGSSNNEADKFYNAWHYTQIYNKMRKTNNEVQVIMKKKPAVRDIEYELLTKVLHSQGCAQEYFSIKDLHNSLV
jgi:hypothetical protein